MWGKKKIKFTINFRLTVTVFLTDKNSSILNVFIPCVCVGASFPVYIHKQNFKLPDKMNPSTERVFELWILKGGV